MSTLQAPVKPSKPPATLNWHLDIITELGSRLGRQIPTGEAFVDWIADDAQLRAVITALRSSDYHTRPFDWDEIRDGLGDLTRRRWLPPIEYLQRVENEEMV